MKFKRPFLVFILILLYVPFLFLAVSDWQVYVDLLQNEDLKKALINSLQLAFFSTLISQAIGLLLVVLASQTLEKTLNILMGVPEILMSLALLLFFMVLSWPLGFQSLLLSHVLLILPFCFLILKLSWKQIPNEFVESAQDLGANAWEVFKSVQWPLIQPSILASFVLGFLLSFDDFLLSFFIGGAEYETLPVRILATLKIGLSTELKALCFLLLVFSFLLILIAGPILINILQKEAARERK